MGENDRKDLIEDDCDHDDYEVDILTGRATCNRCGHRWFQTLEEMEREARRKDAYAEWEAAQNAWSIRARAAKGGE